MKIPHASPSPSLPGTARGEWGDRPSRGRPALALGLLLGLALVAAFLVPRIASGRAAAVPAELTSYDGSCPDPDAVPAAKRAIVLPGEALGVRLCPGRDEDGLPVPAAPADELVQNVASLVKRFNGLTVVPQNQDCPSDLGPTYTMVFRYSDDRAVALTGEAFGCGPVGGRLGARGLVEAFVRSLQSQRISKAPPKQMVTDPCALPSWSWLPADRTSLTTAALCRGTKSTVLDPALVSLLKADLNRATPAKASSGEPVIIRVADQYGQPLQLYWHRTVLRVGDAWVTPSADTVRGLEDAARR